MTEKRHADQASVDLTATSKALFYNEPGAATAAAAADHTSDVLHTANTIDNADLRKEATNQAIETVNLIAEKSAADPATAIAALSRIRTTAEKTNASSVAKLAETRIAAIQRSVPPQAPRGAVQP